MESIVYAQSICTLCGEFRTYTVNDKGDTQVAPYSQCKCSLEPSEESRLIERARVAVATYYKLESLKNKE